MDINQIITFIMTKGIIIGYAILIAIAGAILASFAKKLVFKFFTSKLSTKATIDERKSLTLATVISSVTKYLIYFFVLCAILTLLGVDVTSLIAVASIGSVAIGFGAQSLVQDILAGFFIVLEDQFGVGDIITIEGRTGAVESINMRTTQIRSYDGTVHIIPNGSINIITNMCKDYMGAVVDIDVDYHENLDNVIKILENEMAISFEKIVGLKSIPSVLGVVDLGDSGVTIRMLGECEIKENYRIERELKLRVKLRLDRENIMIPFPQRTVHINKQ